MQVLTAPPNLPFTDRNGNGGHTRSSAAGYLSNFKDKSGVIVPALVACLDDKDEAFRVELCHALERIDPKQAVLVLHRP